MSSSKKKRTNRKVSRNKKKNGLIKFLVIGIVLCIIGYFGYMGYQKSIVINNDIEKIVIKYNNEIPTTISNEDDLKLFKYEAKYLDLIWVSNNSEYLTNDGVVILPTKVNGNQIVKLTLKFDLKNCNPLEKIIINILKCEYTKEYSKDITFIASDIKEIIEINCDFYNYDKTSYAGNVNYNGLIITNGVFDDSNGEQVKMKIDGSDAKFSTENKVNGLKRFSFSYQYVEGKDTYEKNTFLTINTSTDGILYTELEKIVLNDKDKHIYNHLFNGDNIYIQVIITSEYAASSKMIYIDDVIITRNVVKEDIIKNLQMLLPNTVRDNVVLPKTTIYGGEVKYSSSSSNLTITGVVTRGQENEIVTLTVNVEGFDYEIVFLKEIKIAGINEVTPVEIRFIDVGKYGHSDCGESIYIKFGDVDVLIDAGDDYLTTVQAVEEVINDNSNDKILDYVIATHPDSDHIGSMDNIFKDYKVKYLIQFSGTATSKVVYPNYANAVTDEEDCEICTAIDSYNNVNGCSRVITLGEDVTITIINTTFYETTENNSRSVICLLDAYGVKTLFTGDADNNKYDIEDAYKDSVGNIDILKVVHHATANGTTTSFLETIDPEVAIICNGNYFGNKHGHPTYEAISSLYNYDENMLVYAVVGGDTESCTLGTSYKCEPTDYSVDRNGTITILIDATGYTISSENYHDTPKEVKDTAFWATRSAIGN